MAAALLRPCFNIFLLYVLAITVVSSSTTAAAYSPPSVLSFYLQQEFGVNEFIMVPAARPAVSGTVAGLGQEVVYEFTMTKEASPSSQVLGFVRGTGVVISNTASATVFLVSNVVHYDDGRLKGTLIQQGEAIFAGTPWELAVLGGTGLFRNAYGVNVGRFISATPTASNGTHYVTFYQASLSYNHR